MDHEQHWVGLDIGERTTSVCVLSFGEHPVLECVAETGAMQIADALSRFSLESIASVAMESGGTHHLSRELVRLGYPITVLDAGKVSRFLSIQQNKTDRNDARGLAEIGRLGRTERLSVYIRTPGFQEIRDQLIFRDQLSRQRTATRNVLRSMLRNSGSNIRQITLGRALRSRVEQELALTGDRSSASIVPLLDMCEALSKYLSQADKRIAGMASENPVTKRFMQIPGVGPVSAVSFYSAIEDPARFPRCADVGAYLGMVPRVKQSGGLVRRSRITKAGNALTRGHLFMAAGVLLSRAATGCAIRDWGLALAQRAGYSKARVAVARKLAVTMLSMWKHDRDFDPFANSLSALPTGAAGVDSVQNRRVLTLDHTVEPSPPISAG